MLDGLRQWALGLGPWGLFLIALLDSSLLSLPQVSDALVLLLSARHPHRMWLYAGLTTLGSVAGCLVMYYLGRKGGEAFLRKRFNAAHVDRAIGLYQRYGLLVVLVPSLLPPPTPFKLFVLLSGAAGVGPLTFAAAVAAGRGLRYFGQGWLATQYGDEAAALFQAHGPRLFLALAIGLVVATGAVVLWKRRRRGVDADAERGGEPYVGSAAEAID